MLMKKAKPSLVLLAQWGGSHKKRLLALTTAAVLVVSGIALYPALASGNPKPNGDQPVHKESPVVRGDITDGVNETGTASLEAQAVTYDTYSAVNSDDNNIKALVEEVLVKAGQRVKKGDPMIKISTEEIEESLDTQRQALREAQLALEKATLDQQSGTMNAKATLEKRLSDAKNADLNYELDLDNASSGAANLSAQLSAAGEKLTVAKEALDAFEQQPKDYKAEIASLEAKIADGATPPEELAGLQARLSSVKKLLEDYQRSYSETRKKMYAQYSAAANEHSSAKLKYQIAQNNQSLNETTAQQNRVTALSYKDSAQQIYTLEIAQLANAVSSRKLAVEKLEKSIAKLEGYLTDGQVKATCDGLIMNVYVVAGDKVSPNATLASITNSKHIDISVDIDQEDIATLELGKSANVQLDAYPDKKFTGKVDSMSIVPGMGNSSTVSYKVKVRLDNPDDSIFEGMTG
ncbi:MAG: efflux RND transporter periplasmic adaptor subunit, partial [Angelakisella sp.]